MNKSMASFFSLWSTTWKSSGATFPKSLFHFMNIYARCACKIFVNTKKKIQWYSRREREYRWNLQWHTKKAVSFLLAQLCGESHNGVWVFNAQTCVSMIEMTTFFLFTQYTLCLHVSPNTMISNQFLAAMTIVTDVAVRVFFSSLFASIL